MVARPHRILHREPAQRPAEPARTRNVRNVATAAGSHDQSPPQSLGTPTGAEREPLD